MSHGATVNSALSEGPSSGTYALRALRSDQVGQNYCVTSVLLDYKLYDLHVQSRTVGGLFVFSALIRCDLVTAESIRDVGVPQLREIGFKTKFKKYRCVPHAKVHIWTPIPDFAKRDLLLWLAIEGLNISEFNDSSTPAENAPQFGLPIFHSVLKIELPHGYTCDKLRFDIERQFAKTDFAMTAEDDADFPPAAWEQVFVRR